MLVHPLLDVSGVGSDLVASLHTGLHRLRQPTVVGVALFLNFFAPLLPGYLFEHVALWDLSVRGILMENTEPLVSGGSLRELGAPFFELSPETVSV